MFRLLKVIFRLNVKERESVYIYIYIYIYMYGDYLTTACVEYCGEQAA